MGFRGSRVQIPPSRLSEDLALQQLPLWGFFFTAPHVACFVATSPSAVRSRFDAWASGKDGEPLHDLRRGLLPCALPGAILSRAAQEPRSYRSLSFALTPSSTPPRIRDRRKLFGPAPQALHPTPAEEGTISPQQNVLLTKVFEALGPERVTRALQASGRRWRDCFHRRTLTRMGGRLVLGLASLLAIPGPGARDGMSSGDS
jgi:hypothetical protein